MQEWDNNILEFITIANKHQVQMILIGGGAVNFHGYQRHSADLDFWINPTEDNFKKLLKVFQEMNYDIDSFPEKVLKQEQNISIKFSPSSLNLELITRFSVNKSFDDIFEESIQVDFEQEKVYRWRVISYDDLIISKIKAGRPKDLLDIQELQKRKNN
ncbi:MAG: nucleotidyl transferase AbiEii/AbiGii toxin family protein [Nonlabens sp.]|uniref:nucleotidyl transferase AbiEii/AbiGii toxin family protein n=1 Tax=Nonlabens sp. TaxID=1888209 RepID=UPI003EF4A25D